MTLYEISAEMESCILIDEETGDVVGIDEERLAELDMERTAKRENIACWIKNLESDAVALKAEMKALEKRMKAAESRSKSLRDYLCDDLKGEILDTPKARVSFRNTEAVDIIDEDSIPEEFRAYEYSWKPDKKAIKAAIKSGAKVSGAEIKKNTSLIIK